MARNSDIRSFIISQVPLATIGQIHQGMKELSVLVDSLQSKYALNKVSAQGREFSVCIANKHVKFMLLDDLSKFASFGKVSYEFTTTSLGSFLSSLSVMSEIMGCKDRTFANLVLPLYPILMKITGNQESTASIIVGEAFTGLMKRYSNRLRSGSNNNYRFKVNIINKDRPVTFTIFNLDFMEGDRVAFDLTSSDESINKEIDVRHTVSLPTPEVGARRLAEKMKSQWQAAGIDAPVLGSISKHITRLTNEDDDESFYEEVIFDSLTSYFANRCERIINYFDGYSITVSIIKAPNPADNKFGVTLRKQGVVYVVGELVNSVSKALDEYNTNTRNGQDDSKGPYWTKRTHTSMIKWCKKIELDKNVAVKVLDYVCENWECIIASDDVADGVTVKLSKGVGYKLITDDCVNVTLITRGVVHRSMVPFNVAAIKKQAAYITERNERPTPIEVSTPVVVKQGMFSKLKGVVVRLFK